MELVVGKNQLLRELQLFQASWNARTRSDSRERADRGEGERGAHAGDRSRGRAAQPLRRGRGEGWIAHASAKKLYEIIKALPETDVRIQEDKNGVKVAADKFDSRMQTLPREDFPSLPEAAGTASATLPREALSEMVAKTQFAITGEDTRYFLNGALFILRSDSMSLVATDGHRLALVTVKREAPIKSSSRPTRK